jgi:hypothetical protein
MTVLIYVEPKANCVFHRQWIGSSEQRKLQLQVDLFCNEVCDAALKWNEDEGQKEEAIKRAERLVTVHSGFPAQ